MLGIARLPTGSRSGTAAPSRAGRSSAGPCGGPTGRTRPPPARAAGRPPRLVPVPPLRPFPVRQQRLAVACCPVDELDVSTSFWKASCNWSSALRSVVQQRHSCLPATGLPHFVRLIGSRGIRRRNTNSLFYARFLTLCRRRDPWPGRPENRPPHIPYPAARRRPVYPVLSGACGHWRGSSTAMLRRREGAT